MAVARAVALAVVLARPAPSAPTPAAVAPAPYVPTPPARPGDVNPIAAKVLAEGGPRTPAASAGGTGGLARGVGRFAFAYDAAAPATAWTCLEPAARHAAQLTDAETPACAGAGADRIEGNVVVTRQVAGDGKGVDATPGQTCRATLTGRAGDKPLRVMAGPIPARDGDCADVVTALRTQIESALAK